MILDIDFCIALAQDMVCHILTSILQEPPSDRPHVADYIDWVESLYINSPEASNE